MIRRLLSGAVALALTAALAFISPGVRPAEAASFKDTGNHWAMQVVDEANALGLMKGYPGDLFKPEDSVSRLEAIATVIRAMGLENEALSLDYKNSGINLPKGMTWGQGHLVLAVQKGFLNKDYVGQLLYNNPITRQEVAALVAVALQSKLTVKGDPSKLTYADTSDIDLTYRQYVADVTQNNIMQGIGNNDFGPNQIMKRGQMAALMVNSVLKGWFDYGSGKYITGTLSSIDPKTGIATITKSDGTQMPRIVNSSTIFYNGSAESSMSAFKAGDPVLAIVGSDATVKYMELTGNSSETPAPVTETELTGKIADRALTGSSSLKIRDIGGCDHTYPLSPVTVITDGQTTRDLTSLTDGQFVTAKISNNEITSISLLQSESVQGQVTGIYSGFFTVTTDSGDIRSFTVSADSLKITDGSSLLDFSSLKAGDRVIVTSVSGNAREIIRTSTTSINSSLTGEIRGVDPLYWFVTIMDNSTLSRKEYPVELQALIEKGNERVRLADLQQGDQAAFKVGSDGKIYEIIATGANVRSASGVITNLQTGSPSWIYIDSQGYQISSNVIVTKNGSNIGLGNIMIGATATLKMDASSIVNEIDITNDGNATVAGVVTSVNVTSNSITLEQDNGLAFTLPVSGNFTIQDLTYTSSNLRYLGNIMVGWRVKLYVSNGLITTIQITAK